MGVLETLKKHRESKGREDGGLEEAPESRSIVLTKEEAKEAGFEAIEEGQPVESLVTWRCASKGDEGYTMEYQFCRKPGAEEPKEEGKTPIVRLATEPYPS